MRIQAYQNIILSDSRWALNFKQLSSNRSPWP